MLAKRLDHVQLAMPPGDEDVARAFYGQLLGIPEVEKPAQLADRGGCWFEHGVANATLQPLAFLVGDWRTTGTHPQVPGETLSGRTSFTWCEGGALLVMRSTVDHPLFPDGTAVIGGDGPSRRFAMIYCDERGVSRLYDVTTGPRTAVWRRDNPAFSQEVTISADSDGETLTSVGRMSVGGGPWTDDLSQIFVRAPEED